MSPFLDSPVRWPLAGSPDGLDAATRRLVQLGMQRKVVVVEWFRDMVLNTKGDAVNWSYVDLDLVWLLLLMPYLESIQPYTNTVGAMANHMWKVVLWGSYDGRTWSSPTDLFGAITAGSGMGVQTPFTSTAAIGPRCKAGVGTKNSTGTALETGVGSMTTALVFKT